jgi:hypothetical protein
MLKLVFYTLMFNLLTLTNSAVYAKHVGDICFDKYYEGECLKKRNVEDIVPCLRVNFNKLPSFCDPYKSLIERALRRIDPIDQQEIARCEKILIRGCFNTRSTKKIVQCMEENLRNFSPGCEELKLKSTGNIPKVYKENKRIRKHVIKCSRNLSRNCGSLKNNYKKFRGCIKKKLKPECQDLYVIEDFKIKKVYDEFEIANMEYKCNIEKKQICPEKMKDYEKCIETVKDRHSIECINFFRETQ